MHLTSRQRGEWFLMIPHIWILSWVDFPWINFLSSLPFWWTYQHWQIHKLSSCPTLLFSFLKKFVYLKGRQTDTEVCSICWFILPMLRAAGAGWGRSEFNLRGPGPNSWSCHLCLTGWTLTGSWIPRQSWEVSPGAPMWDTCGPNGILTDLNCYSKDPFLFYFSRIQNSK